MKETVGEESFTQPVFWNTERVGRDREDLDDYKVLINACVCFSNKHQLKEYYHNSSWLEHGGAPEKAVRSAFVSQIDAYLKGNNKYSKTDKKITFQDVEDCLCIVVSWKTVSVLWFLPSLRRRLMKIRQRRPLIISLSRKP